MLLLIWTMLLFSMGGSSFDTAEHHRVTCKVCCCKSNIIPEETATLNDTSPSKSLKTSACEVHLDVLTCVCVSEGVPLQTVKGLPLKNCTENFVTPVSNHMANISVTASVKDHSYTTVGCVSINVCGEARESLMIQINMCEQNKDLLEMLLIAVTQPQVIIAFLTGILLSATICCLVRKCHRKKSNSSGNMVETLEMVTNQAVPLMNARQLVENETHDQEVAEGAAAAAAAGQPVHDVEPREVEYSDIDFCRLNRKIRTGTEVIHESTETEYAELKEETEEIQDKHREDGEGLEGNKEQSAMIGEDKDAKRCPSVQEEGPEEIAVYSSVDEIMAVI